MVKRGTGRPGANRRNRATFGVVLIATLALMCLTACGISDPLSSKTPPFTISISMSPSSPALLAVIDQYRVTVTHAVSGDTLAQQPLVLIGSFLEGTVNNLPAGVLLIITVEALEGSTGAVIYRGVSTATVVPNTTTDVAVAMIPLPPLVKLTPRHSMMSDTVSQMVSLEIFNMVDVNSLDVRVSWRGTLLVPDSIRIGPQYDPAFVSCLCFLDTPNSEYIIQMNQGNPALTLVDAAGRAILVDIFFSRPSTAPGVDTLLIEPVGFSRNNQPDIPIASVYSDIGLLETP